MTENGKIEGATEAVPAEAAGLLGALSPEQLEGLLASLRGLPEWKGMIEQEAERLGLFEPDDLPEDPGPDFGPHLAPASAPVAPPPVEREILHEIRAADMGDKDVRFAHLVGMCLDGWLVSVKRLDPTWCAGWCDDYEMDGEEPLTLRRIEHDWGGNKFKVWVRDDHGRSRGIVTVRINGVPKRHGIPIYAPEDPRSMPPAQQQQDQGIVVAMMTEMMKMNSTLIARLTEGNGKAALPVEQLDQLMDLAERLGSRGQDAEPPQGIGGLTEAIAFFKAMAESKAAVVPPPPPVPVLGPTKG